MLTMLFRRAVYAVPLLLAVPIVLFFLLRAAPGSPVDSIIGEFPVPDEYRQQLEALYGLDRPLGEQLWTYFLRAITFDFGYSYANGSDVADLVWSRLGGTLILVVPALLISSALGLLFGLMAGFSRSRRTDDVISTSVLISLALPSFWVAQMLVIMFSIQLGWFPNSGMQSMRGADAGSVSDVLWHLVLPLAALVIIEFGAVARVTRASTLEVIGLDYVTTAQMKGLTQRQIGIRHVLRNASLPAITVIGGRFGRAIAGSILIETVFNWPGMGSLLYRSIGQRENQVLLAIVMVIAISVVAANLITDLVYSVADPRIRNA
ncbi:ABC transporter permease [Nakamurella leprariae]|uniref:ABC transporter permease n=1 Tax=Nakamurella leprariae TaxID=2803911 RepID=A0A938YGP4_9ACTN|nr:ABC transporter permease [Nakamurella leprariae]MBM9467480.1 ABC transporter permease [Nakamurella leprariae]